MPFKMNLWQVNGTQLNEIQPSRLEAEDRLERWLATDPSIAGLNLLIIGRQVITTYGGRIDLLGIDDQGKLVILELKRDRTPREIVAQIPMMRERVRVPDLTPDVFWQIIGKIRTDVRPAVVRSSTPTTRSGWKRMIEFAVFDVIGPKSPSARIRCFGGWRSVTCCRSPQ